MSFRNRLEIILKKGNSEEWTWIIPRVHMRLKVALSVLNSKSPKFWKLSASELEAVLHDHPNIKAQFASHDDISLGFAIRTLRMQP